MTMPGKAGGVLAAMLAVVLCGYAGHDGRWLKAPEPHRTDVHDMAPPGLHSASMPGEGAMRLTGGSTDAGGLQVGRTLPLPLPLPLSLPLLLPLPRAVIQRQATGWEVIPHSWTSWTCSISDEIEALHHLQVVCFTEGACATSSPDDARSGSGGTCAAPRSCAVPFWRRPRHRG